MDENSYHCMNLLADNNIKIRQDALRVLIKICDNIIKYPDVAKYRRIQVANVTISDKLLPASGGIECLFELGFIEDGEYFSLPSNASLSRVENIEKLLRELWSKDTASTSTPTAAQVVNNKLTDSPETIFFQTIVNTFNDVLRYEDEHLQKITRRLIPLNKLELRAIQSLRATQRKIKVDGHANNHELSIEVLALAELLHWFKNEFFTWVDSPICNSCSKQCNINRIEYVNDTRISRIEIHRCESCGGEEKFIRYTDPEILLTTRKGRCGEWANVFTLMCRTLQFDARIVHDKTDHVWTEVWSMAGQRWIHVDPCENLMDCPLLYEKGWKKKLTYIIAYSKDEVQDVTWRYTRDQVAVRKRRNICSEESLSALIQSLTNERQSSSKNSDSRKSFLVKRRLMELADFLQAPPGFEKPSENDDNNEYGGRISGDAAWRLARNEISDTHKPYIWKIPNSVRIFQLRYFIVKDLYDTRNENDKILEMKNSLKAGVDTFDGGIFRNVENDWKMVYLARSPGNKIGKIIWSIEVSDLAMIIETFELNASSTTFNEATVEWSVQSVNRDNSITTLPICNSTLFKTTELYNAQKISVIAKLSGGNGDISWQYAQLFRQSLNAIEECSLIITITVKKSME